MLHEVAPLNHGVTLLHIDAAGESIVRGIALEI